MTMTGAKQRALIFIRSAKARFVGKFTAIFLKYTEEFSSLAVVKSRTKQCKDDRTDIDNQISF
jgi:hypothetical protein